MRTTTPQADAGRPRVLVLASTYPRWRGDHEPGFVHELSRRLAKRFDVTVVCPSATGATAREELDGVRVIRFRYAPMRWETLVNDGGITTNLRRHPGRFLLVPPFVVASLWAAFRASRRLRPAAIHAHWLLPQGLVAVIARRCAGLRAPLVVTSHGADLHAWRGALPRALKRLVVRNAAKVAVVSRGMVKDAVALGARAGQVEVAPMGVDLDLFRPDPAVAPVPGRILFVGRLVEKKGLRHLIDALPVLRVREPRATLVVAGFGPEDAERRAQVEALGLRDAVSFVGAVPQAELPMLYRQASVVAVPFVEAAGGDIDGLGLVAVEAAACGCPVVISRIAAASDIFGEGEATFVAPGNPAALAEALASVLAAPDRAPRADRAELARKFEWSAAASRYEDLLSQAARLP